MLHFKRHLTNTVKCGIMNSITIINNYDTVYTGNTNITIRKYIQGEI